MIDNQFLAEQIAIFQRETREIVAWAEHVDALTGAARTAILISIARAKSFSVGAMLEEGVVGRIHREAWATLKAELDADTLANRWERAWRKLHRAQIAKALRIDPAERTAFYAMHPFRIIQHDDGHWIAGAVGCPSMYRPSDLYAHLDITDVILWNPKTGEVRCDATLVMPEDPLLPRERLTIYGDGYAFFRAWADCRAETNTRIVSTKAPKSIEPRDGDLPGAFCPDVSKPHWASVDVPVLAAGPGIDGEALKKAIYRSARLPRVEDTKQHRRAA